MGLYDAETKTFSEFGTGKFTPSVDGRLLAIRVIIGAAAATSLTEHVQFRLTCSKFSPNSIYSGHSGNGLATAPAFKPAPADWIVDQPVSSGSPITMEGRNLTADTPVTVEVYVYGLFEG